MREPGPMALRMAVAKDLLDAPAWTARLEKAQTWQEVQEVLSDFCKEKGYKVVEQET